MPGTGAEESRIIVISLHPRFAAAIFAGTKGFEFRRVRMGARTGDRIIVYETAPVSQVTGEFRVGRICIGSPADVLAEVGEHAGIGAEEYLLGAKVVTGLEVVAPRRWPEHSSLVAAGLGERPPVSYRFVGRRAAARSARKASSSVMLAK